MVGLQVVDPVNFGAVLEFAGRYPWKVWSLESLPSHAWTSRWMALKSSELGVAWSAMLELQSRWPFKVQGSGGA